MLTNKNLIILIECLLFNTFFKKNSGSEKNSEPQFNITSIKSFENLVPKKYFWEREK